MIKAEVISEDNGYEVPNWLTKCSDILTSPPAIGTVMVIAVALFGVVVWQHNGSKTPVTSETGVQSTPVSGSQLQVATPNANVNGTQTISSPQSVPSNASNATPVGPAPTNSLNSLQPSGSSQQPGGLTQALNQTVQSAGNATTDMLNGLGL